MKTCTSCHRLYPDDGGFCPIEGTKLEPVGSTPVPSDPKDKRIGSTLCAGKYQIYRKVADGGMGRVYQALEIAANRSVALKILHSDVAQDNVQVQRFKREYEFSANLPHEHIVDVLAFEKTEDESYALVMEYLEGEELRMLLKRTKVLQPERVLRMVAQVAIGLEAAHAKKIVHRDLKPDNIFLVGTHDGDIVKILDFGSVRDNSEGAKKLTVMGTTIGSPFYMAPEQAQGLPSLDHRADVWSLAAIAYECLTGMVPFQGPTGPSILLAILTKEPEAASTTGKAHGVPVTVDDAMEEALTKDPGIRVPSCGAFADRLAAAYGVDGGYAVWADVPVAELGERIKAGLPARLAEREAHKAATAAVVDTSAMDKAFQGAPLAAAGAGDPYQAGSAGGPAAFNEDMIMGVPKGQPKWLVFALAGAALLVGIIVTIIFIR